jgi:hypothetical protein
LILFGTESAEGKVEEIDLSSKDPKDPSREEEVSALAVSKEDVWSGTRRNVGFLKPRAQRQLFLVAVLTAHE